jgi:hypothetical protein
MLLRIITVREAVMHRQVRDPLEIPLTAYEALV